MTRSKPTASPHLDPFRTLREKLRNHPELIYREAQGCLRIDPPSEDGFAVELHRGREGWTVYLGEAGFHETFDSADQTMEFIAWCYSGDARIREVWRGASPEKSMLEARDEGGWYEISMTGYCFFRFWRKRCELVLTNPNLLSD